jgi:hypothetical protein
LGYKQNGNIQRGDEETVEMNISSYYEVDPVDLSGVSVGIKIK